VRARTLVLTDFNWWSTKVKSVFKITARLTTTGRFPTLAIPPIVDIRYYTIVVTVSNRPLSRKKENIADSDVNVNDENPPDVDEH